MNGRDLDALYRPCLTGVHVCGEGPTGETPATVANFPCRDGRAARELFERLKAEFAAIEGEPVDLVVDLCLAGDIEADFAMTRQMLDRLQRAAQP